MDERKERRAVAGWVRGPFWDSLFLLNALWLAPILLVIGDQAGHTLTRDGIYLVLTALFWVGHRLGSTYLAYCTTAYRPLLRSQRTRFVLVPIGIALICFAILVPPDDAMPVPRVQRVLYLAILDYLFVTWHFASQHYGILSLYRLRAGQKRSAGARRLDRAFALGVGGALILGAEALAGEVAFQSSWLDPVIDPSWLEGISQTARTVGTVVVATAAVVMLSFEVRERCPSAARALYIAGISLMAIAALRMEFFVFLILWTAQHWIAAIGLSTLVAKGDPEPGPSPWYRVWHELNRRSWPVLLLLATASVLLLPIMEVEAIDEAGPFYADRIFGTLGEALRSSPWVPVLLAIGFTTGFVHYAMDRAIFRFSDPEVRLRAKGLLDSGD
jgi:hypothetical protein